MKKGFWGKTAIWTGAWTIGVGVVMTAGFSAMLYDGCNNEQVLHFPVDVSSGGAKQTKLIKFGTGAFNYGEIDIDKTVDVNKEFPIWPQTANSYKDWINTLDKTKQELNNKIKSLPENDPAISVLSRQIQIADSAKKTYTFYITGAVLTSIFALVIIAGITLLIMNKYH